MIDPFGFASGAFTWDLDIPAGGENAVDLELGAAASGSH